MIRTRLALAQAAEHVELRGEGINIGIISRQLGHTSIAITARYLDLIASAAIISRIARRSWKCLDRVIDCRESVLRFGHVLRPAEL